jgi:hypothetical protein
MPEYLNPENYDTKKEFDRYEELPAYSGKRL